MTKKIVVWGTGNVYNRTISYIRLYEKSTEISIVGVTSNDQNYALIDGYPFISKNDLCKIDYDYIIVCVQEMEGVRSEANKLGIDINRLVSVFVVMQPGFDFEEYSRIVSKNITVISQNCFGGIMCNKLGLRFNSPFVNMWMPFNDYVRLLLNFEEYMSKDVTFYDTAYDEYMNKHFLYPIGDLCGVKLHFNHTNSFNEAIEQWNKRKKRINMKEIIVFAMTDTEDDLDLFDKISYKKILFTSFKLDRDYAYQIEKKTDIYGMDVNAYVNGTKPGFDMFNLINGVIKERFLI